MWDSHFFFCLSHCLILQFQLLLFYSTWLLGLELSHYLHAFYHFSHEDVTWLKPMLLVSSHYPSQRSHSANFQRCSLQHASQWLMQAGILLNTCHQIPQCSTYNGNPLQYSCLENSMDREAWQATVHRVSKRQIWLSDYRPLTHYLPTYLGKSPAVYLNASYTLTQEVSLINRLLIPLMTETSIQSLFWKLPSVVSKCHKSSPIRYCHHFQCWGEQRRFTGRHDFRL